MSDSMKNDGLRHSGIRRRSILKGFATATALLAAIRSEIFGDDTPRKIKVVTLGDSITKGVRPGVTANDTFAAMLQVRGITEGFDLEVINVGIGGERTDQALERFDRDVVAKKPDIITIMYGANDSYVDPGKTAPRISPEEFRQNLLKLVERSQAVGIRVVLMTEPRWGAKPAPNGLGEHPNIRLEHFMILAREVARAKMLPLVDHFAEWTRREEEGLNLVTVTTDLLHPNPAGHRLMADSIWPVLKPVIEQVKVSSGERRKPQ